MPEVTRASIALEKRYDKRLPRTLLDRSQLKQAFLNIIKNAAQARYADLLVSLAKGEEIDGHELLVSRHCLRCNRVLTTPESIESGVGPECAKREAKR